MQQQTPRLEAQPPVMPWVFPGVTSAAEGQKRALDLLAHSPVGAVFTPPDTTQIDAHRAKLMQTGFHCNTSSGSRALLRQTVVPSDITAAMDPTPPSAQPKATTAAAAPAAPPGFFGTPQITELQALLRDNQIKSVGGEPAAAAAAAVQAPRAEQRFNGRFGVTLDARPDKPLDLTEAWEEAVTSDDKRRSFPEFVKKRIEAHLRDLISAPPAPPAVAQPPASEPETLCTPVTVVGPSAELREAPSDTPALSAPPRNQPPVAAAPVSAPLTDTTPADSAPLSRPPRAVAPSPSVGVTDSPSAVEDPTPVVATPSEPTVQRPPRQDRSPSAHETPAAALAVVAAVIQAVADVALDDLEDAPSAIGASPDILPNAEGATATNAGDGMQRSPSAAFDLDDAPNAAVTASGGNMMEAPTDALVNAAVASMTASIVERLQLPLSSPVLATDDAPPPPTVRTSAPLLHLPIAATMGAVAPPLPPGLPPSLGVRSGSSGGSPVATSERTLVPNSLPFTGKRPNTDVGSIQQWYRPTPAAIPASVPGGRWLGTPTMPHRVDVDVDDAVMRQSGAPTAMPQTHISATGIRTTLSQAPAASAHFLSEPDDLVQQLLSNGISMITEEEYNRLVAAGLGERSGSP